MLTKNLLKHTLRSGKAYPHSIKKNDANSLNLAQAMIEVFANSTDANEDHIRDTLKSCESHSTHIFNCFEKLLFDRCKFNEPPDDIEHQRWELIFAAEELRQSQTFCDQQQFRQAVAEGFSQATPTTLSASIYSDLPQYKTLCEYKPLSAEGLIHRYNLAQIQGLLLQAEKIEIEISNIDTAHKRSLFRLIKFHQLMIKLNQNSGKTLRFAIDGPLSIFESTSAYGLKLANFIPYIFQFPNFKISSVVKAKGKIAELKVGSEAGIESHYKPIKGYTPEIYQTLANSINRTKDSKWVVEFDADPLHLGEQNFSFPDFSIASESNKKHKVHIELFHKWHMHQLKQRMKDLEHKSIPLAIGVSRSIGKKKEFKECLESSTLFAKQGFFFTDFPTAKQVSKIAESVFKEQAAN